MKSRSGLEMKSLLIVVAILPQIIFCASELENEKYQQSLPPESLYCTDLNPQTHIDFNMLFGLWYGAEIIMHHESDARETIYDSCVVVHLADGNSPYDHDYDYQNFDEQNYDRRQTDLKKFGSNTNRRFDDSRNFGTGTGQRLRLIWDERGKTVEYTLRVDGPRRGLWISSGAQKGTMLDHPYTQFIGTVQVIKAVGNHLVLTFCEVPQKSQLFTVVLTRRNHILSRDEVQAIRSLLRRRGLNVQSVRKVCRNSATTSAVSFLTIITVAVASILSWRF